MEGGNGERFTENSFQIYNIAYISVVTFSLWCKADAKNLEAFLFFFPCRTCFLGLGYSVVGGWVERIRNIYILLVKNKIKN